MIQRQITLLRRYLIRVRSNFASFFSRMPQRLMPRNQSRRAQAGLVTDLFATLLRRIKGIGLEDMDNALDILHSEFPNIEHSWLIARFERAYESDYPLDATLSLAAAGRAEAERISLALEIYAVLHHLGGDLSDPQLFEKVCESFGIPFLAPAMAHFVDDPNATLKDPVEVLGFSSQVGEGDFLLSPKEKKLRFRAIRCANLVLIINDSSNRMKMRGRGLTPRNILPLCAEQEIHLKESPLSYESLLYLFQAKYAGASLVNYMQLERGNISITQQRTLHSLVRLRFGLHVEMQILDRKTEIELDGHKVSPNSAFSTSYYTPFTLNEHGPFKLSAITQRKSGERRFQLAAESHKILVSNLPSVNEAGALMLTPGLAPASVFEVSYSRETGRGTLQVREGCQSLNIEGVPLRGGKIELHEGDRISLSESQHLRCRFSMGVLEEEASSIRLIQVVGLTREFKRVGRVIDNIDFSLKQGELACILGPSGSGKSTLLNMLAGHLAPTFGSIQYNGKTFSPATLDLRRRIAYIPREDILDEAMTVSEHIYQASLIRRPQLSPSDRARRVQAVLNFTGLAHLSERHVGRANARTISDGERTRLNLGLDLTGMADVFLIDEPISGLSSGDSERVIKTLEDMAENRIIICTLHRPAASLLLRFSKVLVLDGQGQMAFWGSPEEMMRYFKDAAREWQMSIPQEAIRAGGADYVFEVLEAPQRALAHRRKAKMNLWQQRYEQYAYRLQRNSPQEKKLYIPIARLPHRGLLELWRIFWLWMTRTLLGRVRSRMGLYTLLLEGPVLALLIGFTLRAAAGEEYSFYKALHINEYLFLSLILAMFFGLTAAACEILRDRPLLRRESNFKTFIPGYLLSKVIVLTGLAATQCGLYLIVSNEILEIRTIFWEHWGIMSLTAFVGISLSLMVSALARSERTALNIVPLLLVPQILLAGALIRFEEMNELMPDIPSWLVSHELQEQFSYLRHRVAYQDESTHEINTRAIPFLGELCPLRYAFEMMFVVQAHSNRWEVERGRIHDLREQYKESGSDEQIRFIQRAMLALNSVIDDAEEARRILRRIRNAAIKNDENYLNSLEKKQIRQAQRPNNQPLEFYFTNREITAISESVKTARKDSRINETRGFFLSPRQAPFMRGFDQSTDEGSIPTVWRNAIYLFIMGLVPILISALRLRRITREG